MRRHLVGALLLIAALAAGCATQAERAVLYQTATINMLLEGLYDGNATLAELLRHGDFGIGTFDALDGELILLDGRVYQVRADGKVYRPGPETTTPFATVTFLRPDKFISIDGPVDLAQLEALLDQAAPLKNLPLAVKITGRFKYVKTRSVPRQEKDRARLAEVAKQQPIFEFRDTAGTCVGFRCPDYMKGLNVPGCHFHFLTADSRGGGHVLEMEVEKVRAEAAYVSEVHVSLPRTEKFGKASLGGDRAAELQRAEK
jgi:acetolactate decarboxylase